MAITVLGIETSCDETAVALVNDKRQILSHALASQTAHRAYGGVVPEIAARAHLQSLEGLVRQALEEARLTLDDVTGVAATCGPGLIGGVMVGAMFAKALAAAKHLPFAAINHLEAHALTARLTNDVAFPFLLLLVSGGHCQILLAKGVGEYQLLGSTIDDAVGECFDKAAKILGLGYPGGPAIEAAAKAGNPSAVPLPRPLLGRAGCDFSFSGLKTAIRQAVEQRSLTPAFVHDCAASLQAAIGDCLCDRIQNAFDMCEIPPVALVIAGGVAANQALKARVTAVASQHAVPCLSPPVELCTDNGVMVAWAGVERLRLGLVDDLDCHVRPRWPLAG